MEEDGMADAARARPGRSLSLAMSPMLKTPGDEYALIRFKGFFHA
jgi:hypothetical protein